MGGCISKKNIVRPRRFEDQNDKKTDFQTESITPSADTQSAKQQIKAPEVENKTTIVQETTPQ